MPIAHPTFGRRQGGFGLVELMIALVLGLIIIGGAVAVFLGNQQAFRTNEDTARQQEGARVAFELMARELRQAGGNLCGVPSMANVLNNATTEWSSNWDAGPVRGFDGGTVATDIVDSGGDPGERVAATDAVVLLGSGLVNPVTVSGHNAATYSITVNTADHGLDDGDIVLVCDSRTAAIAQITDVAGAVLEHNNGVGVPGNCTRGLGVPLNCASVTGTVKTIEAGGWVDRLSASFWYVGNNDRGGRSLFRLVPDRADPDEMVEDVVDMQIEYLLRNRNTGDLATNWLGVNDLVWGNAATAWQAADVQQVVAARVTLSIATERAVGTDGTNAQTIVKPFVFVANMRNRERL